MNQIIWQAARARSVGIFYSEPEWEPEQIVRFFPLIRPLCPRCWAGRSLSFCKKRESVLILLGVGPRFGVDYFLEAESKPERPKIFRTPHPCE